MQEKRDEADFRLKALDVLLSNPGAQTANKAKMMLDIFPSFTIPPDVVEAMTQYGTAQYNQELRLNWFRIYANSNREKEDLVQTYNQMFGPNDVNARIQEQTRSVGARHR